MIITRLSGGLGNQLFQYAAGFALAKRHGVRLKLDRDSLATDPKRSYELHHLCIDEPFINDFDRWRLSQARRADRQWLARLLGVRRAVDREAGFDPDLFAAGPNVYLDGYWQSERYFTNVADELRPRLVFRQPPDAANAAMLQAIDARPAVCVHVRRGDYVTDPTTAAVLKPCGSAYYDWALAQIDQLAIGGAYFVFSDDPDWAEQHLRPPGPATFVRHNTGRANQEDLRLMQRCRHFVISNSTFGWWAAWLGSAPDKRVIAPRPWFATPHASEIDLLPADWIRPT